MAASTLLLDTLVSRQAPGLVQPVAGVARASATSFQAILRQLEQDWTNTFDAARMKAEPSNGGPTTVAAEFSSQATVASELCPRDASSTPSMELSATNEALPDNLAIKEASPVASLVVNNPVSTSVSGAGPCAISTPGLGSGRLQDLSAVLTRAQLNIGSATDLAGISEAGHGPLLRISQERPQAAMGKVISVAQVSTGMSQASQPRFVTVVTAATSRDTLPIDGSVELGEMGSGDAGPSRKTNLPSRPTPVANLCLVINSLPGGLAISVWANGANRELGAQLRLSIEAEVALHGCHIAQLFCNGASTLENNRSIFSKE